MLKLSRMTLTFLSLTVLAAFAGLAKGLTAALTAWVSLAGVFFTGRLAGVLAVDWLAVSLTRGLAGVFLDGAAGTFPVDFVGDV
jgi:hypothetical protein